MDRKLLLSIFSIGLAIIVPLYMAFTAQSQLDSNPIVKVKITGYDPRDLLYGHYLMFQYDWNWSKDAANNTCNSDKCCMCVEGKEIDPEVVVMECSAAKVNPTCAHIIKGQSWGGTNFHGPQTQFYVDETKALPLEGFFREQFRNKDFHLGLSLSPSGKARIERLYIEGVPYLEYMAAHPEEFVLKNDEPLGGVPIEVTPVEPTAAE